jgi:hypothetical protein
MTDKAPQAGAHRWLVTATFDGGRSEQLVTPNLGGAFFATFRGGSVELTATLRECPSSSGCSGDVEVTVNARRDDPATR